MIDYLVLLSIPCLVALIVTPLLRQTAIKSNALDYPGELKIHKSALPRLGGIAIAISFFFSVGVGYSFLDLKQISKTEPFVGLCIGAAIIALVGIWDDIRGLNASKKFIGQIAAVLATIPFGFIIRDLNIPFAGIVDVGNILGTVLSIFWVTGIINTINLIDGIDGLAGMITISILGALFIISVLTGQVQMAFACVVLAGAVIGFLRYNFHPATIFMGDCGSMFLGFITALISIKILFQNPAIEASSTVPVLLFGLPIMNTAWAILRRIRKGRSPFAPDLGHIHNRLLNLGLSQRLVVFILFFANLLSVSSGLAIVFSGSDGIALVLCVMMLVIGLATVIIIERISPQQDKFIHNDNIEESS
jgi:UDP-GlcNAc:undecaprenyl-phosphate/decaprenyl-phosphate GlcNAc-1-phosphate transferase